MDIEKTIPLLEEILAPWQTVIGEEYAGYRNHVYRMIHFCWALSPCDPIEREKIIIAGAFHDLGIWIEDTVDYIGPSIPPAMAYLQQRHRADWSEEIRLMISEHHKITEYKDPRYPLVELFRKGDLVDFSLGLFHFGLPPETIEVVKAAFPNANFHANLVKRAIAWFPENPFNPAPMMKW
jgi:hypothetical protein